MKDQNKKYSEFNSLINIKTLKFNQVHDLINDHWHKIKLKSALPWYGAEMETSLKRILRY
jgi:hypothetical protein